MRAGNLCHAAVALLTALTIQCLGQQPAAACTVESPPIGRTGSLVLHLSSDCTASEREQYRVSSKSITEAMVSGHRVELVGVVVTGDLSFDDLPVQTILVPKGLSAEQEAALRRLNAGPVRLVHGPLILRDSVVQGSVRHRSVSGTLQFEGAVDFRGTVFEEAVDLSRSMFQGTLDLSKARFTQTAYFIQGEFMQDVICKETKFGPHTRFHRSVFRGAIDCTAALFDGMTEFIEVNFEQPVTMKQVRFGSGTGFSGSRFARQATFVEAVFSRDAFFGFTVFEGVASFAGARFLASVDFSDAKFNRADDLVKASFDRPPLFTRTKRETDDYARGPLQSVGGQYVVTLFFLLLAALLVAYAIKLK